MMVPFLPHPVAEQTFFQQPFKDLHTLFANRVMVQVAMQLMLQTVRARDTAGKTVLPAASVAVRKCPAR